MNNVLKIHSGQYTTNVVVQCITSWTQDGQGIKIHMLGGAVHSFPAGADNSAGLAAFISESLNRVNYLQMDEYSIP
ncbi:TPA: hypothetical protein ACOEPG_002794 [Stenotrophomonas maltophilia]